MDREHNDEHYPRLTYPEVYLLKDGYKAFFEHNDVSNINIKQYKYINTGT